MSTSWSSSRRARSRMGASSRCRTCSSHYCSAGLSWLPPKRCPRFLVHASWPKHRMSFEPRDYLRHILLETEYLISQTPGLSFEAFIANPTLNRAFVRSLEIIGEAAKKVPGDLRAKYPDVDWRGMAGMRDRPDSRLLRGGLRAGVGPWCSTGCQRYGGKWKRFSRHSSRDARRRPSSDGAIWASESFLLTG